MNVALPSFNPDDVTVLDVCAGFGMLGEAVLTGLDQLGYRGRVICHIERDSAAAAALVARMAASPVDQAPVWDDLTTFDGRCWRGCVDIACAGLPCQPYSPAGKRRGNADHRSHGEDGDGPIPHFLRIVGECHPAVVFCENVPAWVVGGHFRSVGEELCRLGYTLQSPIFVAAGDVRAPHERERAFVMAIDAMAYPNVIGVRRVNRDGGATPAATAGRRGQQNWKPLEVGTRGSNFPDEELAIGTGGGFGELRESSRCGRLVDRGVPQLAAGEGLALAGSQRREGSERGVALRIEGTPARRPARKRNGQLGDPERNGGEARTPDAGEVQDAEAGCAEGIELRRWELPLFPPGRGDESDPDHPDWWAWSAVADVDASLMPRVEPELSMVADGMAFSRADLLRIGGNGVVTLAAAVAFVALWISATANVVEG